MVAAYPAIVGHTTATSTRLWWHSDRAVQVAKVRLEKGAETVAHPVTGRPTETGTAWVCDAAGLKQDSLYEFMFVDSTGTDIDGTNGRIRTLPEAPDEFAFLFGSCHSRAPKTAPWTMWQRMLQRAKIGPIPRLLLLCGDQVYADGVSEEPDWRSYSPARLQRAFEERYADSWMHSELKEIWSMVPTYMMWDDHEIVDDWGSNPIHRKDAGFAKLFEAAEAAYANFQHAHNPDTASVREKDYGFTAGPIGFYVLDLRTYRGVDPGSPILGDAQLDRFQRWLMTATSKVEILFLVTPTPLAHISRFIAESARRAGNKVALTLDLADQWTFGNNLHDLDSILNKLFWWQNLAPLRQCVVLGGDVHTSSYSEIHSDVDDHVRRSTIPQFTSSAISNLIGPAVFSQSLEWFINAVGVRRDIELVRGKYWSQNHFAGDARNFGDIQASRDLEGGWKIDMHLWEESRPAPRSLASVMVKPL